MPSTGPAVRTAGHPRRRPVGALAAGLSLVVAVLAAGTPVATVAAVGAAPAPCRPVWLFTAAGTGADVVGAVSGPLAERLGERLRVVTTPPPPGGTSYAAAQQEAVGALSTTVTDVATRCPGARLMLVGYSEGAHVAGDLASRIGTGQERGIPPERILAVGLFGDPARSPFTRVVPAEAGGQGVLPARAAGFGSLDPRTIEVCAPGDPVCDSPARAAFPSLEQALKAPPHASYPQLPVARSLTSTQWAVDSLARLADAVPDDAAAAPPPGGTPPPGTAGPPAGGAVPATVASAPGTAPPTTTSASAAPTTTSASATPTTTSASAAPTTTSASDAPTSSGAAATTTSGGAAATSSGAAATTTSGSAAATSSGAAQTTTSGGAAATSSGSAQSTTSGSAQSSGSAQRTTTSGSAQSTPSGSEASGSGQSGGLADTVFALAGTTGFDLGQGGNVEDGEVPEAVASPNVPGRQAVKMELPAGGKRSEVRPEDAAQDIRPGERLFFGYSAFLPQDFPTDFRGFQVVWQLHDGETNTSPPVALEIQQGKLWLANVGDLVQDLGPVTPGQNVAVEMEIEFAIGEGSVSLWRDGRQVLDRFRPPKGTMIDGSNFLKTGIYRDEQGAPPASLFLNDLRIGDSRESVSGLAGGQAAG